MNVNGNNGNVNNNGVTNSNGARPDLIYYENTAAGATVQSVEIKGAVFPLIAKTTARDCVGTCLRSLRGNAARSHSPL